MRHLLIELTGIALIGLAVLISPLRSALSGEALAGIEALPGSAAASDVTVPGSPSCKVTLNSTDGRPFLRVAKPVLGVSNDNANNLFSSYNLSADGGSGSDESEGQKDTKASHWKRRIRVGGGYLWFKPDYGWMNMGLSKFAFSQTEYQSNSGAGFADLSVVIDLDGDEGGVVGLWLRTLYRRESVKDADTDINMDWLAVRLGFGGSWPVGHAGLLSQTGFRWAICPAGFNRVKVTGLPIQNSIYRWWWRDRETAYSDNTSINYAPCAEVGWYLLLMDTMDLCAYALGEFGGWGIGISLSLVLPGFLDN